MDKAETKPQIRFRGFSDAWEQRKFDEVIIRIATGLNPRDNFTLNSGGSNYYVTIKNFEHGHLYLDDFCDKIDDAALKRIQERSDLKKGDILFSSIGRIGDCYLIEDNPQNWNINESVFTLRPNKKLSISLYLFHVIHADCVLFHILNNITGSTFKSIKISDLKNAIIPLPKKIEQQKIGFFLTNLDNIITLHQRKLDKISNFKKAMLEKMFSKNGADTPEVRFKGFFDSWEQNKIKNLCSIGTGKSNTQDKVSSGKYPFYVRSPIIEKSNKYIFDEEAVITVGDGVGTGKVYHYIKGKYDLHQRCYRMTDFSGIAGKYFFYYFSEHFYNRVMMMTAKTSVDSVRLEMIADMEIQMPNDLTEQNKIATFFDTLDNLITLYQSKLEKLKNIKKACLEKMFI